MKIDRMFGILTILAEKKRVKAKELAERFEVSLRTIHRDIEYINMSGIPIITYPGGNGGIGIAEGFTWDKSLLTPIELQNILLGLKSLGSVMIDSQIPSLVRKISTNTDRFVALKDEIIIDLASHYKSSLAPKINVLRVAISNRNLVTFEYFSKTGQTKRIIEPYFITFKWSAWYVFGYCLLRNDFRLFKLNRLIKLSLLDEQFNYREISDEELDLEAFYSAPGKKQYATLILDRKLEYVMVDTYGPDSYEIIDDNTIITKWDYINEAEMVKTILGLGAGAKVIDPPSLVNALMLEVDKISRSYK